MGKVHGSLARAGKVRGQTPKVAKQDKKKKPRGRAHKRMQYNRRFVTAVVGFGKKRGPNSSEEVSCLVFNEFLFVEAKYEKLVSKFYISTVAKLHLV
ncbi:small ribosomal subunit protein eS30z/eS30y/eS30x isoform X2 [Quercus suber]|uniref:small ribosomal subunit protein eS30z/eS30y/eS30x isoform X1 n=1 Tax=Quercus suber TaxID=58331 RepID=UPI0032E0488D